MTWSNKDPRDTYIDQRKDIVVCSGYAPMATTWAWVDTLGIADGASTDRWDVSVTDKESDFYPGLDAEDTWPDHWYWCLPPGVD